jgi:hypothetical protein
LYLVFKARKITRTGGSSGEFFVSDRMERASRKKWERRFGLRRAARQDKK